MRRGAGEQGSRGEGEEGRRGGGEEGSRGEGEGERRGAERYLLGIGGVSDDDFEAAELDCP